MSMNGGRKGEREESKGEKRKERRKNGGRREDGRKETGRERKRSGLSLCHLQAAILHVINTSLFIKCSLLKTSPKISMPVKKIRKAISLDSDMFLLL